MDQLVKIAVPVSSTKPGRYLIQGDQDRVEELLGEPARRSYHMVIDPGVTAGNHYHKKKREAFQVISGIAKVSVKDPNDEELDSMELHPDGTIVFIPSGLAHAVENIGNEKLILFVHSNLPAREKEDDFDYIVV